MLDTGRLPQATYDLIDRVRDRYDKAVEVIFPNAERVQSMVRDNGLNLFYANVEKRELCCRIRKVEPLNRFLSTLDAWVTGLRRDQTSAREKTPKIEIDRAHAGIVKTQSARRLVARAGARLRAGTRGSDQSPPRRGLSIGGL